MNQSQLKRFLVDMYTSDPNVSVWIEGPPGTGKSQIIKQVALDLGEEYGGLFSHVDIRPLGQDRTDVMGFPEISEGLTHWRPQAQLPKEGRGFIVLEELALAPPSVQGPWLQLMTEGCLGAYTKPEKVQIIATSNHVEAGAGSGHILNSLRQRFTHVTLKPELQEWLNWASKNNISTEIMSFLQLRPDLLNVHDPERETNQPNLRNWTRLSSFYDSISKEVQLEAFSGTVGVGAGAEFMAFLQLKCAHNLEEIQAAPNTYPIPSNPSECWALISALLSNSKDNLEKTVKAAKFIVRMSPELALFGIRLIQTRMPKVNLRKDSGILTFLGEHKDDLIGD